MTSSKKTGKYLLFILACIAAFLTGALVMTGLYQAQSRTVLPATGQMTSAALPAALPSSGDPQAATDDRAGLITAQVLPAAEESAADSTFPEQASAAGETLIFFPVIQNNVLPPFVAKNVILFIGDGMGLEHVKAGGIYANGEPGTLSFESFPYQAHMTTDSASGLTDSAAAATAMATGHKVNNKVISMAIPGRRRNYLTLLEYARMHKMSTGLVTTTPITDATPASFGAHTESRVNAEDIAQDYLKRSRPNVLFGGGSDALTVEQAIAAGYTTVSSRDELLALDTESESRISGQFGNGYLPYEQAGLGSQPHLSEMAAAALRILDNDPDGFFIVIEGGRIDTASHANNAGDMVGEVAEFSHSVQAALDWAAGRTDTIIVVLSDHETGGLQVERNNGQGAIPEVTWESTGHTHDAVGVWAIGDAMKILPDQIDNTEIPALLTGGVFRLP